MKELKKQLGPTLVYITHDMGVIAEVSDRVAVMYLGNICEVADTQTIFERPVRPYTQLYSPQSRCPTPCSPGRRGSC